jgi:K+-transporting ATPase A subunit
MKQKHYKLYIKAILYCNFWSYIFYYAICICQPIYIKGYVKNCCLGGKQNCRVGSNFAARQN